MDGKWITSLYLRLFSLLTRQWNNVLTSVVNRQQQRLWIVGNGAVEDCGSNKLGTDLQQDHKNDKVDSSIAVMSDLKQNNNNIDK